MVSTALKEEGITSEKGLEDDIDIINGTLSKSFGQMGGYVAANSDIIDYIGVSPQALFLHLP